jgi:NAD(P)-dependent dehydrogenase (short-subunit alcohol dehydrogenase family)
VIERAHKVNFDDEARTRAAGVALVTGGGRGIGAAIASELAAAGLDVAIASQESEQDAAAAIDAVRLAGRTVFYRQFDVTRLDEHQQLVNDVRTELGPVTCLANNAGVSSLKRGDILDLSVESFDRTLAVNLRGAFFLTQCVAREMCGQSTEEGTYRSIINITSANAQIVGPDRADYCVSKAGLSMVSRLFAVRLADAGIRVFEIRPGIIRTSMTEPAGRKYDALIESGGVPLRRWGTPDDVGRTVAALATGRLPFSTGEVINVGGGLHLHRI